MGLSPRNIVEKWVEAFNRADIGGLAALYHEDAVNHQVAYEPVYGRAAIRALFETEFSRANMECRIENLFEDGDWGILEWSDPIGLRGCGFFKTKNDQIIFQRGYFDRLTFYKAQGIPLEEALK